MKRLHSDDMLKRHPPLLLLLAACSDGSSIDSVREVQELVALARQSPRPELDDPVTFYSQESSILLDTERSLQFVWDDQLPLVSGMVNGIPVKAIPDTAAYGPILFLDSVAARECAVYIPNFDRKRALPEARGGYSWCIPGFVDNASFGGLHLPAGGRIEVIQPIPHTLFGSRSVPAKAQGLVGIGQITTHMLFGWMSIWDLPANTIQFRRETSAPQLPPGSASVEARWEQGSKRVWLTAETRTKTFEILIDTGSQLTILPPDVLPDNVRLDDAEVFSMATGEMSAPIVLRKARLDLLRLGSFELRDFEIAVSAGNEDDYDATLSAFDLREYGIVFLPEAQEVHLFRPGK